MANAPRLKPTESLEASSSADKADEAHRATLTTEQFVLLNSLPHDAGHAERALVVMAELLADDETLAALARYEHLFEEADIDVASALTALPRAIKLRALMARLEYALELTRRNYADTVAPVAQTASEVRRFLEGMPRTSRVRSSFAQMDARWQETFAGGRRKPRVEADAPAAETPAKPR